jgi:transposase
MTKHISIRVREKIISAYNSQKSISEISKLFGYHKKTVKKIITTYLTEGKIGPKPRGGSRPHILMDKHNDAIKSYISKNCSISLEEIKKRLNRRFGIKVSISTIFRSIQDFSYTLKRVSLVPKKRNDKNSISLRYKYSLQFSELLLKKQNLDKIFFLDELGFNISMRFKRGRASKGEKAIQTVRGLRTRNISACCTMSKNGAFYYKKQNCPFNRETFSLYLDELLLKFEEQNLKNVVIIMDNVRFHHCGEIKKKVIDKGHRFEYLPPYSPFLNPIENMFAQWKQFVKRRDCDNENELLRVIDESLDMISSKHCKNYFEHMLKVLERCKNKEGIFDE